MSRTRERRILVEGNEEKVSHLKSRVARPAVEFFSSGRDGLSSETISRKINLSPDLGWPQFLFSGGECTPLRETIVRELPSELIKNRDTNRPRTIRTWVSAYSHRHRRPSVIPQRFLPEYGGVGRVRYKPNLSRTLGKELFHRRPRERTNGR